MRNLFPFVLSISFVFALAPHPSAWAADALSVVDIRSNIPLADDEPVYKDFYISGASVAALKKNLVVTAVRKIAVRDANGAQSYGDIEVPVGQLRVLAVFGRVAVAREYKSLSRDEHPMLEQTGIMNGDNIDLKGSFTDAKPRPAAKRVSEATPGDDGSDAVASVPPANPGLLTTSAPPTATPASATAPATTAVTGTVGAPIPTPVTAPVAAPSAEPAAAVAPSVVPSAALTAPLADVARAPAQNPLPGSTTATPASPTVAQ